METKINIAAILNGKPTETKLWSPMLGDCIYCYNNTCPEEIIIAFTNKNGEEKEWTFSYSGRTISAPDTADICLYPSKQMQDWSKFAWKKGDILVNDDKNVHIIFEAFENDTYTRFKGKHYLWKEGNEEDYCKEETFLLTSVFEKVNDDAVKCYINIIEERLGGKLNRETLEVEKALPEFKDGDIVVYGKSVAICRKIYKHTLYFYVSIDETFGLLFDDNRVSSEGYRFAKEEEKQQLFDALAKEGKRWNPDTKLFEDLPKKYEFKPFDKVLVRDYLEDKWMPNFFSCYDGASEYKYGCIAGNSDNVVFSKYCIPYNEETKHLLGTTDEWKGGEG